MNSKERFERKVKDTVQKYQLVTKKDKIIVACSGGKDSTTVLYLLNKFGYNVEALIIDLLIGAWSEANLANLKKFCKEHKIKLHVINMRKEFGCSICYIRTGIQERIKLKNCTICGVIKRWLMNKKARELGATKLATGHNIDDEVETLIMNFLTGNPKLLCGMGPLKDAVGDNKFVNRVKPLYFCTNADVRKYSQESGFPVLYDPCPCSVTAFRREVRRWIADFEDENLMDKELLVRNFLKISPKLKGSIKSDDALKHCKVCEEPSRNDLCKRCELIKILGVKNA